MKTLHFSLRPYKNYEGVTNPGWVRLILIDNDGEVHAEQEIRKGAWRNNETECQEYWKMVLLSRIRNLVAPDYKGYDKSKCFTIDAEIYKAWYEYTYYIDGEDARAFIDRTPGSKHSPVFQVVMGIQVGWKYYKRLIDRNYRPEIAAQLAYMRGYLAGMEINSPWDREGSEALNLLGLRVAKGYKIEE